MCLKHDNHDNSIVNISGGGVLYDHLLSTRIFTLIMN